MPLYHVTPTSNLPGILKYGLHPDIGPRSQVSAVWRPAVFLFPTLEAVTEAVMNHFGAYFPEDVSLALLEVTIPKSVRRHRVHYTPYLGEIAVYGIIPPSRIRVLSESI